MRAVLHVVVFLSLIAPLGAGSPEKPELATQLRRPVAMVLADEEKLLLVANRRSGSISVVELAKEQVAAEVPVAGQLSDMAALPDGKRLLALDEAEGRLLVLGRSGSRLEVLEQIAVSPSPVAVAVSKDGKRAFVTSLWSHRLTIVELPHPPTAARAAAENQQGGAARVAKTVALPFAPREVLPVRGDTKLIVADAFGGRLAVVDSQTGKLEAVREIPAHNIRGLATTPDGQKLLVSHQILNDLAETTHNDVHWGVLMSNVLRWLVLDRVLSPEADLLAESHVHLAGDSNTPGADPAGVTITRDGTAVVALAGAGELGVGKEYDYALLRVPVGLRPTEVVATADGTRAYVANTFSDSITVVDLRPRSVPPARVGREIPLGPQPELSLADRGELLFYDARLALDGWFSCHSCHTDGHSNGVLNDNLGDGSFGAPKRVLSLLGVGQTGPWAWDGTMNDLERQVRKSIRTTMQGSEPSDEQVMALVAYLQTLEPPPSQPRLAGEEDPQAVARGREVFTRQGCGACHAPPQYTTPGAYDVGLSDKLGQREFNPPSLRGVSQGGPFFHDNRAASLEEVFTEHRHQLEEPLSGQQLADLLHFLRSL